MISLLIGLGGIGTGVVRRVKKALEDSRAHSEKAAKYNEVLFCSLDIDPTYDAEICKVDAVTDFKVSKPTELITTSSKDPEFLRWWIPGYKVTAPIEGTRGAGQIRINGRLAFYANYASIAKLVQAKLSDAKSLKTQMKKDKGASGADTAINVFIVSTLAGGTGAGILVDTVFLLRNNLEEEDRIIGVLFDGSVVAKVTKSDTVQAAGLAALTEIEHWMANSESYRLKYIGGELHGSTKFFDICNIIQAKNMAGKAFHGKDQTIKENYQMLAATYLEQIVTQQGVRTFIEANCWNRYDNLGLIEGRSCRYAGFAVSKITFPADKVTNYCYAKFVTEKLREGFDIGEKPDVHNVERALGICEQDGSQLTNVLRRGRAASAYLARQQETSSALGGPVNKPAELATICDESGISDRRLAQWLSLVDKYKAEMAAQLGEIEATVEARLRQLVLEMLPSLRFDQVLLFLNEFRGSTENNMKHVTSDKKLWDKNDALRAKLASRVDAAAGAKRGFLGLGSQLPAAKRELTEALRHWSVSELEAAEHGQLEGFYARIRQHIDNLISAVSYVRGLFEEHIDDCAMRLGSYVERGWIVNPERFASDEYLLNLELASAKQDVDDRIYPDIAKLHNEQLRQMVQQGKGDKAPGIDELFAAVYSEYAGDPAKAARRLSDRRGEFGTGFKKTVEDTLLPPIAAKVQETKVGDALDWFLARTYSEVVSPEVQRDAAAREQMARRLAHIFGEDRAESLLSRTKDETKWRNDAAEGLFRRIDSLTKPFVAVNEAQVKQVLANEQEALDKIWNRIVFLPEDFRYADAAMQLATEKARSDDQIVFYTQFNFFPPFTLTDLARPEVGGQYASHLRTVETRIGRGAAPGTPYHADVRFYGSEWRDNLIEPQAGAAAGQRDADYLLLMGLGLGYITRHKMLFDYCPEAGRRRAQYRGIEKLNQALLDNAEFRRGLADLVYGHFMEIYNRRDRIAGLDRLFTKSHDMLAEIKVGQTAPSFETVKRLRKGSDSGVKGKHGPDSIVPAAESDVEELKTRLERLRARA